MRRAGGLGRVGRRDGSRVRVARREARVLRAALVAVLWLSLFNTTPATADGVEMLMVPSAAMGRDIPVAFQGGGTHAAVLLDAFNAGPETSNWIGAGAFNTLAGKGISAVAPAGGAWSLYTNWEQDSGKQWETFLSSELPDWLAANRDLAPGGHGVVGAAQGGYAAATLAALHADRFRYAGSLSGFLTPERTGVDGAITDGLRQYGGVDTVDMWGPPQFGRWKWHSPNHNISPLVHNNTRLWIFSPSKTASDPAAMIGYPDIAQSTNVIFYSHYREAGGKNGHFELGAGGDNGWSTWGSQLGAMSGDLVATIR